MTLGKYEPELELWFEDRVRAYGISYARVMLKERLND